MTQSIPPDRDPPPHHGDDPPSFAPDGLRREFLNELRARSEAAEAARAELPRSPGDADLASQLFEDFRRRRQEEASPVESVLASAVQNSVADLFRNNGVLASSAGMSASSGPRLGLPGVGDTLFGFNLRQELGRGAFARVFLAEQTNLADRPVVLKVSGIDGDEPQTLAQLQHTHIVPIYSAHEDTRAGVRAVCMPYFGGASLSQVLEAVWKETDRPTESACLVRALAAVGGPPGRLDAPQPASEHLSELSSYLRAAVWLVGRLAEGLQHAHDRGVLHRDIKPSNVLLTADGQPMLLDFNLAHQQSGPKAQASAALGGTVAYMAPEHLSALASRDPALARKVDHRADIYSLGMVLFEVLTGHRPFDQSASYAPLPALIEAMAVERGKASPSLRAWRADVPWSLESIVRRCLAPDPAARYQQAGQLAEDLRRFLADEPLKFAPELSLRERCRKWTRRHPRVTAAGWVAAVAALFLAVTLGGYLSASTTLAGTREELSETLESLNDATARNVAAGDRERKIDYQRGTVRALCRANFQLGPEELRQGREECERTLALYNVLDRDDWQDQGAWTRLEPAERQHFAEDTRELLLMLAWTRVYAEPKDAAVLRSALQLLDRAERVHDLGPSKALWEDRASYLELLHEDALARQARERAGEMHAITARDHYQLAVVYARRRDRDGHLQAIAELNEAIQLNPAHYWSWMQRGFSYQELDQLDLAAADFSVCVGLWPELAWGHYNRGSALYQAGHREEAIRDYTAALACDPGMARAWANRGLARSQLHDYAGARGDYEQALRLGYRDATTLTGLATVLEQLGATADADRVFAEAIEAARGAPKTERIWVGLNVGFALSRRAPAAARQAFEEVLDLEPTQHQALYGLGMIAMTEAEVMQALPVPNRQLLCHLHREAALRYFDQALDANPAFPEGRRFRAVLRARCGRLQAAEVDLNWCLSHERPATGPTQYACACMMALQAAQSRGLVAKDAADRAIVWLKKALAQGYGREQGPTDPDLFALHGHPEFTRLFHP